MNKPCGRFLWYALIGLVFGILDWFYISWLAHFPWGRLGNSIVVVPVIILLNYGIWLVPLVPVVLYEAHHATRAIRPILAGMLTWSCAIFSYYAYYAILLSAGKLVHLEALNIFGKKYPGFWDEYWAVFDRIILQQFIQWIFIALVGGAILGAFAFWLRRKKLSTA